ncbi:MAG: hypothetical protein V1899_04705 [Planctomycetota bacterium]
MSVIKNHGEKLVFGIILLSCAAFIAYNYTQNCEPDSLRQLDTNRQKIQNKLSTPEVTAQYAFSSEEAGKLAKFRERFKQNLDRPTVATVNLPQNVVYPRPMRPSADPATKPGEIPVVHTVAVLGDLTEVAARGDHGCIFISYKLPKNMKHIEVVRVEVYRGDAADKINTQTPYSIIEYGTEEPVALTEEVIAPTVVRTERIEPNTETMSSGERWRREKPVNPPVEKDKEKDVQKPLELPAELAGMQVHPDVGVDPKKPYYYQLRLVGRMLVAPGTRQEEKAPVSMKPSKILVYDAPKDAINIVAKNANNKLLFISPLSKVVKATSPANYEIRLSGTDESAGPIPPLGTPDHLLRDYTNYKGNFVVRVWVKDAQKWEELSLQVGINEKIKGTISYKPANSREHKPYDFDSGYVMLEIKKVSVPTMISRRVPKLDATGTHVSSNGIAEFITIEELGHSTVNAVAVLKDTLTDKIEEYSQSPDYLRRAKDIALIRAMATQQEAERKADMARKKVKPQTTRPSPRP